MVALICGSIDPPSSRLQRAPSPIRCERWSRDKRDAIFFVVALADNDDIEVADKDDAGECRRLLAAPIDVASSRPEAARCKGCGCRPPLRALCLRAPLAGIARVQPRYDEMRAEQSRGSMTLVDRARIVMSKAAYDRRLYMTLATC